MHTPRPSWVISGHAALKSWRPLYPRKLPRHSVAGAAVKGQQRTSTRCHRPAYCCRGNAPGTSFCASVTAPCACFFVLFSEELGAVALAGFDPEAGLPAVPLTAVLDEEGVADKARAVRTLCRVLATAGCACLPSAFFAGVAGEAAASADSGEGAESGGWVATAGSGASA
jgi:hypothetical protein